MAFFLSKRLANEGAFVQEYGTATANEAITLGEALVFSSGTLTKCAATATPEVIALASVAASATPVSGAVPYMRVTEDMEFETTSTATVASTLIGSKVTLHTDGLKCTATTSSGVFQISATDGVTTTSTVRGYFRR